MAVKSWLVKLSLVQKIIILSVIGVAIAGGVVAIPTLSQKETSYQVTKATKGVLMLSVSGSGTISAGNSTNITTGASGKVTAVYVTNGDTVQKGDKIADIALDDYGTERQAYYYSKYVDALVAAKTAEANKSAYDIDMWEAQKAIDDAQDDIAYRDINTINPDTHEEYTLAEKAIIDKALEAARKQFTAAELKYKNADAQIAKAQTQVTATWRDYQEVSSTIVAPADGVVSNLALYPGVVIESSSTSISNSTANATTSTSITTQQLGKIDNNDSQLEALIALSESDVTRVKPNQKVTLTLDAYSDKTFTGKVLAVDTSGSVASGVTTYPVTVLLDTTDVALYPNMAVSATIITNIKTNVLLIPSSAIAISDEQSTVQVLKNGAASTVTITTGETDGTKTEIQSGLSANDEVVTDNISANSRSENNETSDFSSSSQGTGGSAPGGGVMMRGL